MGFLKALAVIGGVGVGGDAFDTRAAHKAGDEATIRQDVQHGELFGQAERIVPDGQDIAEQENFGVPGVARQNRPDEIHGGIHAGGGVVVFIDHQPVKPHLLAVLVFIEVAMEQAMGLVRIVKRIGEGQPQRRIFRAFLVRIFVVGQLGEIVDLHARFLLPA